MVSTDELISYIYNNLRSGYSISQIEQELIKEGMSKEQIQQYIEYVMDTYYQHDNGVVQNSRHHSPNIAYFFGIVGVLVLFIIISIVFFSGGEKIVEPVETVKEYVPDDAIINITSDEINDNNISSINSQNITELNNSFVNDSENITSELSDNVDFNNISSVNNTSANNTPIDSRPSIIVSGDFETYEIFSGTDVFNIDESKTILYNNESYVVTLKGLNSDAKSYILDIDGDEKTFRYGIYQKERNLAVFAYDFVVREPYAYVKLLFPNNDEYYLVSNKENNYMFEDKSYVMEIVDSYELEDTITLSVNNIERTIQNGKTAVLGGLYINVEELHFDNLVRAFAKLSLANTTGINGTLDLNLNHTQYSQSLEPYNAEFSIEGIDVNNSKINYSVSLGSAVLVNETPLVEGNIFDLNNLTYIIDHLDVHYSANWTVTVNIKYS